MSKRIDGQRLMQAVPDLVQELGAIHDALAAGDVVVIEPGSVKAARIHAVMDSIEQPPAVKRPSMSLDEVVRLSNTLAAASRALRNEETCAGEARG